MLKHPIKHLDWDGNPAETILWFNLDEAAVADIEFGTGGARLSSQLKKLSEAESKDQFWDMVKLIVLKAYGSRDGDLFWQNDEVSARWRASSSFNPFMMWLCASEANFFSWFRAILPAGAFEAATAKIDTSDWQKQDIPHSAPLLNQNPYPPVNRDNLVGSDPNFFRQQYNLPAVPPVPPAFRNQDQQH